jgi:hypothetical protein
MISAAALLACLLLAGLALFQILLIAGRPLGMFAWGGQHRILPKRLRMASVASIALYVLFALAILAKAGLVWHIASSSLLTGCMWVLTGYFFLGIVMNALSRSKPERLLMTPVAAMLAALFLYVTTS